jgi:hypothetical protein
MTPLESSSGMSKDDFIAFLEFSWAYITCPSKIEGTGLFFCRASGTFGMLKTCAKTVRAENKKIKIAVNSFFIKHLP